MFVTIDWHLLRPANSPDFFHDPPPRNMPRLYVLLCTWYVYAPVTVFLVLWLENIPPGYHSQQIVDSFPPVWRVDHTLSYIYE